MSTTTLTGPTTLDSAAQALSDARLDTIERMLLDQVARADRLAIVREVEAQIHDLLAERNPDDTDRDAVIAALARLDPPEAYLPDATGEVVRPQPAASRGVAPMPGRFKPKASAKGSSQIGKAAGVLGLIAIALTLLSTIGLILGLMLNFDELPLLLAAGGLYAASLTGLQAIIFAGCARLGGHWAIVGLTTGLISLLLSVIGLGYTVYLFLN